MVTTIPGLLLNVLYVFTNIGMGVLNHTAWFIYLGGYYFFLTIMKSSLVHDLVKNRDRINYQTEYQKYRNCGIVLLLLNFVLVAECIYIVCRNQSYHYDGMLIYAMAYYSMISAVIHVVRYRKYKSPVLSAMKAVKLTTSMVTMLALETADYGAPCKGCPRRRAQRCDN